jgi:hypothetical protein
MKIIVKNSHLDYRAKNTVLSALFGKTLIIHCMCGLQ